VAPEHELKALSGALYALCDTAHSLAALVKATGRPAAELEPVLQDLIRRKLMLEIDGQFLTLAVIRRRAQKPITRNNHDWIQIAAPQAAEPLSTAL
jgi:hypothetical protein